MTDPSRILRTAFGTFATGVTVITTVDAQGRDTGLTANSFSSVSLEPPLLLWSLSRQSTSFAAFMAAGHYAVHVLAAGQEALSARFARKGADKFEGVQVTRGEGGVPLLEECAATFVCRSYARHDAGDHVIFLGEIVHFEHADHPPLIYHGGRYAGLHRPD